MTSSKFNSMELNVDTGVETRQVSLNLADLLTLSSKVESHDVSDPKTVGNCELMAGPDQQYGWVSLLVVGEERRC